MLFFNLNESNLYIEENLKKILMKIESPVASWLLRLYTGKNNIDKLKKNNIDVMTDSNDTISFIPDGKDKSKKSFIKIGRFVRELALLQGKSFEDSTIETFVNKYKAAIENKAMFKVVSGQDILDAYMSENYKDRSLGSLGNSCMNNSTEYLKLYTDNPNVCKLLVLMEGDSNFGYSSNIIGRALLWYDNSYKVMDRIYTRYDSDIEKFKNWARENDFYYKKANNSGLGGSFIKGNQIEYLDLKIELNKKIIEYYPYPYLDTLAYAYDDILTNVEPELSEVDSYIELRSTSGEGEIHETERLYDYNDEEIPRGREDDYVDSNIEGGLIPKEDSVKLEYSYSDININDYVLKDNSDIIYSELDNKYYLKNHCVWSDYENDYLFRGSAIYILKDWVHELHLKEYYDKHPELKNPFVLEKSTSKSQQRLFGWAYACRKGYIDSCPRKIRKLGDSLKMKDLKDLAKTKHKELPERKTKK